MALHTLLYTSVAFKDMKIGDLEEILHEAREFNTQHNITGLLLYYPRTFMQVLEGEKETIFELFDRIVCDARHTAVSLTFDEPISMRMFPDWSMGFRLLDQGHASAVEGLSRFLDEGFKKESEGLKKSVVREFLLGFKNEANASLDPPIKD